MADFLMPSLGADMEVGTVLEWRVHPGDVVHRGDIVAVVDTEKSDIEVEVFEDGLVEELLVETGRTVPVGTPLARLATLDAAGHPAPPPAAPPPATPAPAAPAPAPSAPPPSAPAPAPAAPAPAPSAPSGVRSSPLARRRAAESGVTLAEVAGSGPGGAVVAGDVAGLPGAAGSADRPAPAVEGAPTGRRSPAERQASMRHALAELLARSQREVPHYYLATTVDLHRALEWLRAENERRPVAERLLPAVLLLKATALAARDVPALNGFWTDRFSPSTAVHVGVAVSLRGGGLVAPAIHDADQLPLDELMGSLRDLVERARAGRLRSSEMSDPTLTVTNLGERGAEEVFGVVYPPQVALVGFGSVVERPWAEGGMLAVRPTVRATLAADHRASDGHDGSRLLATIDRLLQAPEAL